MPKSRFNAVREKARASRHNPLQRGGNSTATSHGIDDVQEAVLSVQPTGKGNEAADVLPVLKSLPLPTSAGTSSTSPEDALWALTSLTNFLSTKASRNELLLPKHDVVSRILVQLQGDRPIEVRDAASGCLRNLCIEAAGKARKALEGRESMHVCLQEVQRVAQSLNLLEGHADGEKEIQFTAGRDLSFLNKPKSEMNRKERRHAAKAEAAAAKKHGKATETNGSTVHEAMETESTPAPPKDDDDKETIRLSHLTNLAAIVWCMVEMSPEAEQSCERAAPMLCRVFAQAAQLGVDAIQWLQLNPQVSESSNEKKIDVGRKDRRAVEMARVEAANTCMNALVTLSDSNATVCGALIGVSRQDLQAVVKGKGKVVLDDDMADDLTRTEGAENTRSLYRSVELLAAATDVDAREASNLTRQASSLGLLSLAVIRNMQSSLPVELRKRVKIEVGQGSFVTLSAFETNQGLVSLQRVVTQASQSVDWLFSISQSSNGEAGGSTQKGAFEEVNNLNLALEVLAEMVGDAEGWSKESSSHRSKGDEKREADEDSEDESMDVEEDSEEGDVEIEEDAQVQEEENATESVSTADFAQSRIAKLLSPALLDPLSVLAFNVSDNAAVLSSSDVSTVRGVVIRALSVLNNSFIVLASYAQPPPSQPVENATQQGRIASFHAWLRQGKGAELGKLWRWSFELASKAAAAPIFALDESKSNNEEATLAAAEAQRIVETCLGIMWSISRCYEGTDEGEAANVLLIDSRQFADDTRCTFAQQGNGVVESLLAAYRASKQEQIKLAVSTDQANIINARSTDGIRVASLGVLSTIVRQAHVWPSHLSTIVSILLRVLEALPPRSNASSSTLAALELRDWTSLEGMVVAANGLIDTFADETRPWDANYRSLKVQGKLKRASADVRTAARSIDKRTQTSLRTAADEVWENLMGFLQYRDSLKV